MLNRVRKRCLGPATVPSTSPPHAHHALSAKLVVSALLVWSPLGTKGICVSGGNPQPHNLREHQGKLCGLLAYSLKHQEYPINGQDAGQGNGGGPLVSHNKERLCASMGSFAPKVASGRGPSGRCSSSCAPPAPSGGASSACSGTTATACAITADGTCRGWEGQGARVQDTGREARSKG